MIIGEAIFTFLITRQLEELFHLLYGICDACELDFHLLAVNVDGFRAELILMSQKVCYVYRDTHKFVNDTHTTYSSSSFRSAFRTSVSLPMTSRLFSPSI